MLEYCIVFRPPFSNVCLPVDHRFDDVDDDVDETMYFHTHRTATRMHRDSSIETKHRTERASLINLIEKGGEMRVVDYFSRELVYSVAK